MLGIDIEDAMVLLEAGFDTPRKIKKATKNELKALKKMTGAKVDKLKKRW